MSDNSEILEQLKENNPFFSAISPAPFENKNSDIESLNRGTSEEIYNLLKNKRFEPEMPIAGLVIGEPGAGKTHMLARILRRFKKYATPIVFVAVKSAKAFTNPQTVTQGLWSEILTSMAQIHSNGHTQFDMLLSRMMDSYRERREEDGFTDLTKLDPRLYLAKDMLDLNKDMLRALMLYLNTSDEINRMRIFEWLRDGMDDEEALELGLPMRDIHAMTPAACEEAAKRFLISLGYVLAYSKVSMVVCFDQLEGIKSRDMIQALGDMINLLVNDTPGVVPLCFVKAAYWDEVLRPNLDPSVRERAAGHTMVMKGCSLEQARHLVHERIAARFQDGVEEKYSWLMKHMDNLLKPGMSPRRVIELAYRVITTFRPGTDAEETFKTFKNIYEAELAAIQDKPKTWLPNAVHLASALKVWLNSHEGFETMPGDGKYIQLTGHHGSRRYAFVINTSKYSVTAVAGTKRGIAFLKEYPEGTGFYIADTGAKKSRSKKLEEQQKIFEGLGGRAVILDDSTRAGWYALTSLINQIESGDVDLYLSSGNRTANLEDIREFARSLDLLPGIFTELSAKPEEPPLPPLPKPPVDPKVLADNMAGIIKASPMKLLTADKAVDALARRNINVSRDQLLDFLKHNRDSFRIYTAQQGEIMVGLS